MSELKCTGYETGWWDNDDYRSLCRCPLCKGWLPRSFPTDKPFTCKKCGAELMAFPELDEESGEEEEWGKICPISI